MTTTPHSIINSKTITTIFARSDAGNRLFVNPTDVRDDITTYVLSNRDSGLGIFQSDGWFTNLKINTETDNIKLHSIAINLIILFNIII